MYKTYTAKAIDDRNKAHIEAINNPDNVLKMFRQERNWTLPEEEEAASELTLKKEEVREAENKPVNPFLKGVVFGMVLAALVFVVTYLVVAL